jgi:LPXTG-site transpeptidase (sortase) family protein
MGTLRRGAPDDDPELWLGRLVLEVQKACDRAVAAVEPGAGDVIDVAQSEADGIREAGRLRAEAISALQAALRGQHSWPDSGSEAGADGARKRWYSDATSQDPTEAPVSGLTTLDQPLERWAPTGETPVLPAIPPTGADPGVISTAARLYPPPGEESQVEEWPIRESPVAESPVAELPVPEWPVDDEAGERSAVETESLVPPAVGRAPEWLEPRAQPRGLHLQGRAVLIGLAIVAAAVGLLGYEHLWTATREHRAQQQLAAQFAALQSRPSVPTHPAPGTVFASLQVPRLGIDSLDVVEGVSLASLRRGPAHVSTSQAPGETGAVVIVGHRSTYGAPFGRLGALRVGDVISLRTPASLYVYRVEGAPEVVRPGSGSVQLPSAAQVVASGGPSAGAYQTLVLATADSTRGQAQSMEVVVATLDQPAAVGLAPSPGASNVVAQFGVVPGESIGFVLLVMWLLVIGAVLAAGASLTRWLPPALVSILQGLAILVCVYQVYLAIDRMVPGTH